MHVDPATATSTAVILTNRHGQYLLHLRDANKPICDPGTWSLIGGGPEGQETPDKAIVRELREEADLVIPDLKLFTTVSASGPHVMEGRIQVYEGRWDGDANRLPVTEGIMFRWFDVDTMVHLSMCPWAYEAILAHHAGNASCAIAPVPAQRPAASRGGAGAVKNVIGAHLYLERDGHTLLGLRHPDAAYAAEHWHALAGHVERESVRSCLVREAAEEAGLVIRPEDLDLVHTVHLLDHAGAEPRIGLFFRATAWCGEPEVREPDRCVRWEWWPLDGLPKPMVAYTPARPSTVSAPAAPTPRWGGREQGPPASRRTRPQRDAAQGSGVHGAAGPPARDCVMSGGQRHREPVDVHLVLRRDGAAGPEVLLSRRAGDVYASGLWHLPSGHLDGPHEDVVDALIREAHEETSVIIDPAEVRFAVTLHHRSPGGGARTGVFFEVRTWQGTPVVREPAVCDAMDWFRLDALPDPMVAYCRAGLDTYRDGQAMAVHFQQPDDPIAYDPALDRRRTVPAAGTAGAEVRLREFTERAVGRVPGWTDASWAREGTQVWRAAGAEGGLWFVKVHQKRALPPAGGDRLPHLGSRPGRGRAPLGGHQRGTARHRHDRGTGPLPARCRSPARRAAKDLPSHRPARGSHPPQRLRSAGNRQHPAPGEVGAAPGSCPPSSRGRGRRIRPDDGGEGRGVASFRDGAHAR